MSASEPSTGIFMTDTPKEIEKKIKKNAYSGGGATKEEHEKNGANLEVDISYHYLRFFLEDDAKLKEIGELYGSGKMMTGEVKKILIEVLQKFVGDHQLKRKNITVEKIEEFLKIRKIKIN